MKKVVMTHSVVGIANSKGTKTKKYFAGDVLPTEKTWEKSLAKDMIARGAAMEVQGNAEIRETKRARDADGKLMADDPSTPDVNEAWEGGKAPTKKKRTTRKKA